MIKIAPKPEDLTKYTNKKYGNLVITKAYRDNKFVFFDVVCDCGNKIPHIQKSNFFKRIHFKCDECAALDIQKINLESLIGNRYNKLVIVNAYRIKRKTQNGSIVYVDCVCDCGEIRKKIAYDKVKSGTVYSCRKCAKSISKMEMFIKNILIENNVCFEWQKKFADCKDTFELPFDFYLSDYNTLIEYDGSQHYEKNHFNNTEETFNIIQYHDKLKSLYAKNNDINLIRFTYKQTEKQIKDKLLSIIGCENRKKLLA